MPLDPEAKCLRGTAASAQSNGVCMCVYVHACLRTRKKTTQNRRTSSQPCAQSSWRLHIFILIYRPTVHRQMRIQGPPTCLHARLVPLCSTPCLAPVRTISHFPDIYIYIWVVVNIRSSRLGGCSTLRGAASFGRENLMTWASEEDWYFRLIEGAKSWHTPLAPLFSHSCLVGRAV